METIDETKPIEKISMNERIKQLKKHPVVSELQKQWRVIWLLLLAIQLFILIGVYSFNKGNPIILIITFILTFFYYLLFKDEVNEQNKKNKRYGTNALKTSLVLFFTNLMNLLILNSMNSLIKENKIPTGLLNGLLGVLDFLVIIFSISLLTKDKLKTYFESLEEKSIFNDGDEDEFKPGDARIGFDTTTGNPVRLPLKDRYLHMLLLGPTGSGKTALSLTPMVNRDMQARKPDGSVVVGITVIEPKGDFAEKVWAMAKIHNRDVIYFNPILKDCPYFNPLEGPTTDVIENMATTFKMFSSDSSQYFQDMNDGLLRKAIKVIKMIEAHDPNQNATLIGLSTLINNTGGQGRAMVTEFSRLPTRNDDEAKEQEEIASWFTDDYFTGCGGGGAKGATKTYENTSAVRTQIAKLNSNYYLRKVLNPPPGEKSGLNFDKALETGQVLAISVAQGALQDLSKFLGYFIILQFQSSVFRRPGNEDTRLGNMLYIDEFQVFSNRGFENMLTQGRSYRVASHLATQNRALIGANAGKDGKAFIDMVSTNARNQVIYGGGNYDDGKFYSNQFGERIERRIDRSVSRPMATFFSGFGSLGKGGSESIKEVEESVAYYTASDIIYKDFGYVTYSLMKNNSLQRAGVSKLDFIPYELKLQIDKMVEELNAEQIIKDIDNLKFNEVDEDSDDTGIDFHLPDFSNREEFDLNNLSNDAKEILSDDSFDDVMDDFVTVHSKSEAIANDGCYQDDLF